MKLYILRHGDAAERGDPRYERDDDRPLTNKGIARTEALARALVEWEVTFDALFSSPLVRAHETAEIVARALHVRDRLALTEHLAPAGDVGQLVHQVNALQPAPANVLLVGHEPDLSGLISLLCTGGSRLRLTMKKGGLCRMEIPALRAGQCATLEWLLSPAVIAPKR
jgi:phosphohistidine phosphatase